MPIVERQQVAGMGFLQSMRWTESTTDTTMMSKSPVSTSEESISDESSCSSEDEHGEQTTLRMATHREKEEVVHPCDPLNQSSVSSRCMQMKMHHTPTQLVRPRISQTAQGIRIATFSINQYDMFCSLCL